MIERKKIIVNGKEVKKRFLGSRLVWEIKEQSAPAGSNLIYDENEVSVGRIWDDVYNFEFHGSNPPTSPENRKKIKYLQINDKPLFKLEESQVSGNQDQLLLYERRENNLPVSELEKYLELSTTNLTERRKYRVRLYTESAPAAINYESYKKYDKFTIVGYYASESKIMFYRSGTTAKTPELDNAKFKGVKFKDDVIMPLSDYRVENKPSGTFLTFFNVSNEMKEYFYKNKGGASRGDGFGSFKTVIYYE